MDRNEDEVKHLPGCPLCEHCDPELERLVKEFAEWCYGVTSEGQKGRQWRRKMTCNALPTQN
jgi:hypothetical protein